MSTSRLKVDRSINKMNPAISEIDLKAGFVENMDLEAGKRKHCPKGYHKSYRTRTGRNRSKPKCVRSHGSKRRSPEPKHHRHMRGVASPLRRGRKHGGRCANGYYRTAGGACRSKRLGGGEGAEFEGGEDFDGEFEGGEFEGEFEGGEFDGDIEGGAKFTGGAVAQATPGQDILGGIMAEVDALEAGRRRPKSVPRCPKGKVRSYRDARGNMYRTGPRCVSGKGRRSSPYSSKKKRNCKRGSMRNSAGRCVRK